MDTYTSFIDYFVPFKERPHVQPVATRLERKAPCQVFFSLV